LTVARKRPEFSRSDRVCQPVTVRRASSPPDRHGLLGCAQVLSTSSSYARKYHVGPASNGSGEAGPQNDQTNLVVSERVRRSRFVYVIRLCAPGPAPRSIICQAAPSNFTVTPACHLVCLRAHGTLSPSFVSDASGGIEPGPSFPCAAFGPTDATSHAG